MKPDESIRIHIRESEGYFVASCLELAIVTQGCTLDETVSNVKEAVCLFLEDEDPEPETETEFIGTHTVRV